MPDLLKPARAGVLLAGLSALFALSACGTPPPSAEAARLHGARFVLLGEVHDNAEQHRERAELLRELMADGRPTTIVFEQMDRTQDAALATAPRDAESIASAGRLDRKAWQWPLHKPLLEAAADGGARVRGGNLPLQDVRAIVRGGAQAVPADLRPALQAPGWPPAAQTGLEREIDEGHCHALPPAMWAPMALAQRARDAAMADAMLQPPEAAAGSASSTGAAAPRVVLIAGNGHVRTDWGVPFYLRQAGIPAREIVSVAFLEQGDEPEAPFDLTRRTPRAARSDPCAALQAR